MLLQNGYSGAPVSVHAFSTNNMPGALPPLKGAHFDPNTPDMEIPPFLELSDHSFEQVNLATPFPAHPVTFTLTSLQRHHDY